MTIDTGKRSVRMQSQKQIFAIVLLALIIVVNVPPMRPWLSGIGLNPFLLSSLFFLAYVAYYLYFIVRNVEYLFVSDTTVPNILRIRHFKLRPLETKKEAMEILHNQVYKYEYIKGRFGRESIVMWQNLGGQLYKYPPFSITILTQSEKTQLFQLLDQYVQEK